MSVLLTSVNLSFLAVVWGTLFLLLSVSFLICLVIIIRRLFRNKAAAIRAIQKAEFDEYLSQALINSSGISNLNEAPECHIFDMTELFLHYFRTLKGEKNQRLVDMIVGSPHEDEIIEMTKADVRGNRMVAVRTLSYLNSQSSLQVIFENLSSEDKYIRLTAARCLVRRNGLLYLSSIIEAITEAFPADLKILAGIVAKFGHQAVEPLEKIINETDSDAVRTNCLEALVLIMPPSTSLDLGALMRSHEKSVRAAALSLSSFAAHADESDPLRMGLQDKTTFVKMRAVKMANDLKRADLTPDLYKLSADPEIWIQYWAYKAIWGTGVSGKKFVLALAETRPMAGHVAKEISSGYV